MDVEKNIALLKSIEQVEAPPFLLTRIEAKLNAVVYETPKSWKLAFVVCSVVVLFLNLLTYTSNTNVNTQNNSAQIISSMQLESSNNFYHE